MKKLALSNVLLLSYLLVTGQGDYLMYETMYIIPKSDKIKELRAALAAHNKKYHTEGPDAVTIQRVMNGSRAGQLAWVMGPLTFSDLDNRPSDQAHTDDWNAVMRYIDEVTEAEYWRMDPDLSYTPEGWTYDSKIHVRFWELKHGRSDEVIDILKKIVDVFRTKQYDHSWHVYWNYFQTGNGRDIAGVFGFDNWAFYDEDPVFFTDFEEIHGEGSWEETYETLTKATAGMTEELREVIPELGVLQFSNISL
jgi:hypothetical protein